MPILLTTRAKRLRASKRSLKRATRSLKRATRSLKRARAYTVVEVMVALAVLAVGAMGVIALQKFTVAGALNARGITSATTVADSWIDLCQNEAAAWNRSDNSDVADMPVVSAALASPGNWVTIPNIPGETPNGGATPLYSSTTGDMFFCSQIRATWLGAPDPAGASGSQDNATPADVIRIDVRTFFAKSGRPVTGECNAWSAGTVDSMLSLVGGTAPDPNGGAVRSRYEYGFVYESGTIRRNTL
jgi:prepilin-type N-terminal cleavage/methylation domain-containing protein